MRRNAGRRNPVADATMQQPLVSIQPLVAKASTQHVHDGDAAAHQSVASVHQRRRAVPKERRFKGIPAAHGIVIGTALVIVSEPLTIASSTISHERLPVEHERLDTSVRQCSAELQRLVSIAQEEAPVAAPILDAQLMILNDPVLGQVLHQRIDHLFSAEASVQQVFDEQRQMLLNAHDAYLRERAIDLENVKNRVLDVLCNRQTVNHATLVEQGSIVISSALTPSDVIMFKKFGMTAFVTELSGVASHTAILARSLHIPSVIGVPNIANRMYSGAGIIVDGYAGIVIIHPKADTIAKYERRQSDFAKREKKLGKLVKVPSVTSDGRKIHLLANADSTDEIEEARSLGAEGVGLVRTEMQMAEFNRLPTEEEQTEWYTELAEHAYPMQLTVRAFDIGSDKSFGLLPPEPNPALGLRGLRFLLKNRAVFAAQVRAILRASQHRNLRLMLPMVTSVQEFQKALAIIEKVKESMRSDGIVFDEHLPVGAMIETPSAAVMARELGALADFFSIGTNDLVQYTLAADRLNTSIINVYDAFHPAVLRLIKMAVDAAQFNNISVAVCGEFAGHSAATELLVGLGIEELSVVPSGLLELKKRVRGTCYADSIHTVAEALQLNTGAEVRKHLAASARKHAQEGKTPS